MIRLLKMEYTLDCGLNRLCWRSHDDHTHTHMWGVGKLSDSFIWPV